MHFKSFTSKSIILFLCIFLSDAVVMAQSTFLNIDKEDNLMYESTLINSVDSFHSSIYPHIISDVINYQSIQHSLLKDKKGFSKYSLNKAPIHAKGKKNDFRIVPLINLKLSKDFTDHNSPYTAGAGLLFQTQMGKKFTIQYAIYGALQQFNVEDQRQINSTQILPHIGEYNAKINSAYSYTNWQGYVSYQAAPYFNIQVGKDQNFWGDGYRSLLLSDNSSPYPFIKATVSVGKLKYIVLYQFLKDIDTEFQDYPNEKKYSTSHYLSWNIGKRININLFESVIWRDQIENGPRRGFDFNYANPIIFFRPVEFSIGSPDNMIMGGGFRFRMFKKTNFYGQVVMDEFKLSEIKARNGWWANKYGYQIGMKVYDLFKVENLFILGEYNWVRPFTYSHWSSMENYGNMFQSLAHPLGANFNEFIGIINYRKNRWQFQGKLSFAQVGIDSDSINNGHNIYRPYNENRAEYGHETLQGELTQIIKAEAKATYIINPVWNLKLETGIRLYRYSNTIESQNQATLFIGLKTIF